MDGRSGGQVTAGSEEILQIGAEQIPSLSEAGAGMVGSGAGQAEAGAGRPAVGATRRRRRRTLVLTPYLLALPTIALVGLFVYGMVNGILQGFGIMPYLGLTDLTLEYYRDALTRPELFSSVTFSLYLAGISSVLATVCGVGLAAAMTRLRSGRKARLVSVQVPIMTAHIVVVLFVVTLLGGSGLVPRLLHALGLLGSQAGFPSVVGSVGGIGIVLVYLWKGAPFIAFSTLTIMGNIEGRFAEAAASLGASPLRAFFNVTLPLCGPTIAKAFLIIFAFSFGAYEVPFLLGATVPRALPVLAYLQFSSPELLDRAHAMALNGIMSFITLGLALLYSAVTLREARPR